MAIETKAGKETKKPAATAPEDTAAPALEPLKLRDNPDVKKRIEAHKAANPRDVVFYGRLVAEHPQRAVDQLILKDAQKHENEMRLIHKQLPQAKAFYEAQSTANKARIDQDLAGVHPYYADKALVNAVIAAKDRQARRELTAPMETPEVQRHAAEIASDGKIVPLPKPDHPAPRMAA